MTNNLDATVFVFRHKDGSIVAMYPDQAKAHKQNPKLEHVATLEPQAWIQAHYDEIERGAAMAAEPDGWQLVPVDLDPYDDMTSAACDAGDLYRVDFARAWRAALAAAPKPEDTK